MKVLFDQGTPVPLRKALSDHVVATAVERRWDRLGDRELLDSAEAAGFDVLVTTDQNLRHQQVLTGRHLALLVLRTTNWRVIEPRANDVANAISTIAPGSYIELSFVGLRGP